MNLPSQPVFISPIPILHIEIWADCLYRYVSHHWEEITHGISMVMDMCYSKMQRGNENIKDQVCMTNSVSDCFNT